MPKRKQRASLGPSLYLRKNKVDTMPPNKLRRIVRESIISAKQGVLTTRLNQEFRDEVAPPDTRVRLATSTIMNKARKVWLYHYRYTRFNEKTIKRPAMRLWAEEHLANGAYAHIFVPDVVRRLMTKSKEQDMFQIP